MKVIIFDTETSGLIRNSLRPLPQQPAITELYAKKIIAETGEMIGEFWSYFNPPVKLEKEAAKVTGQTMEFLREQPKFCEKIVEIEEFFSDCDMIAGQNVTFDLDMMTLDFKRCGRDFGKVIGGKRLFCTVEATTYMFGYRPTLTLLHETLFGEGFSGSHGARADVEATERCFLHMWKEGEV